MIFTVWRDGYIQAGQQEGQSWEKVEIESSGKCPFFITTLGTGVFTVREGRSTDIHLMIFKQDRALKPRSFKLHDIPFETTGTVKLASIIFQRLLTFDDNRLSNRDRNIAITIIRQCIPETVSGFFENKGHRFRFHLYNNLLSIFKSGNHCVLRTGYTSFSRAIKDNL